MRIFVTGAGGFIGRAFSREAVARGHELLCLGRAADGPDIEGVSIVLGDIENPPWAEIECFAPEGLMHLAWVATPGEYLNSPLNARLAEASQAMIGGLVERGVQHLAVAGTCIEYAPANEPLIESSPTAPEFPYSIAKQALHDWLADQDWPKDVSWSWMRIFYPYGPGEHPARLTTSFLTRLAVGSPVLLNTPGSVKDFIYITDLASALCTVLDQRLQGAVNIGTGQGVAVRRLAEAAARTIDADRLWIQDALEPGEDPRPCLVADTTRIRSIGWRPEISLEEGLRRLADSLDIDDAAMECGTSLLAACPGCGAEPLDAELALPGQPTILNYPFSSREEAQSATRADLVLSECSRCGLVWNTEFDPMVVPYDQQYENTQCHSPAFSRHLEEIADGLNERYQLAGKAVLEVGCGKGDFLKTLCLRTGARGFGYDTTYEGLESIDEPEVRFFRHYVSAEENPDHEVDLIVCRHVVEHVPEIGEFMAMLCALATRAGGVPVVIETPAWEWIVEQRAFWDVFYEHCNYFPLPSLARIAGLAGFAVIRQDLAFGEQYQLLELRPMNSLEAIAPTPERPPPTLASFALSVMAAQDSLRQRLDEIDADAAWAIWGAGAKGVALANALGDRPPALMIDINPGKQGSFTAGAGVPIVAPNDARLADIGLVVVANPMYLGEIRADLGARGLNPRLIAL